jgi:hypothetical protein
MAKARGAGLRALFVLYCLAATAVSLVAARPPMSRVWVLIPFVIGLVFYLVASVALQTAHAFDGRSLVELLLVAAYPYFVYAAVFLRFDVGSLSFWAFPGVFYFLMLTGGFVFGMILAPLLARREGRDWGAVGETAWRGIELLKTLGLFGSALIVLPALVLSLAGAAVYLALRLWSLDAARTVELLLFLAAGAGAILIFSFRHTVFGTAVPSDRAGRPSSPGSDK